MHIEGTLENLPVYIKVSNSDQETANCISQ